MSGGTAAGAADMVGNSDVASAGDAWLCDLADRLTFTHRLEPGLFAAASGLPPSEATALATAVPVALTCDQRERLELAINIVLRLEWRLHADTADITAWLATPNDALGGGTPAEMMAGGADALRTVRHAVGTVSVQADRW